MVTETSPMLRARAAEQMAEADAAELPNVRARALRAAASWNKLADLSERANPGRAARVAV